MLPESIKKQIEVKYGHEIRYPKDCENLALHITDELKTNISASTLKRLFGFVKSESKPNKYTLDIIARFLDAENWEILNSQLSHTESPINEAPTSTNQGEIKKSKSKTQVLFVGLLLISLTGISIIFILRKKELAYKTEWKKIENLPEVRKSGQAICFKDQIFYIGGFDAEFVRNNNWSYSTSLKKWTINSPMPTPRAEIGTCLYGDQLFCFGGWQGNKKGPTDIVEVYNIKKNSWDTITRLPKKLISVSAVTYASKIYILGGTLGETNNYFFEFDPKTRKYETLHFKSEKRIHFSLIKDRNKLYVLGGNSFSKGEYRIHTNFDVFHLKNRIWESKPPIPEVVMNGSGYLKDGEIHLIGGKNKIGDHKDGLKNTHLIYNLKKNQWSKGKVLPFGICEHQIIECRNRIFLIGGAKDFPNPSKTTYLLNN